MKRFLRLTLLLFTAFSLSGFSQVMNVDFQRFYDDFDQLKRFNESTELTYDGSPYLDENFESGKIILDNGKEYSNILLRYNVYYDQFEFSRDNKPLAIEKDPQFVCFIIGKKSFYYRQFKFKEEVQEGYLEMIIDGDYSLYLKHTTILREGEDAGAYREAKKPTFFPQKPVFMIGSEENGITVIKGTKDFYNKFQNLEDAIKNYTGKKKLKLKTEQDYIELVNFLNSKS